jgi:Cu/Ag efflux protein CusF
MKDVLNWGAASVSLVLAACGDTGTPAGQQQANQGTQTAARQTTSDVHSGEGDVTAVSGQQVTISHGPIEALGWPAMTMSFKAASPELLQGINVGDPVSFQFRQEQGSAVLTSISKAQ